MELQDVLRIGGKRWLSIVLCAVLGGMLALAYSLAATKVYSATAHDFVAIGGVSGDSSTAVYGGANFALQRVKSYPGIVETEEVLAPVIADLGLDTTPQALAGRVSAANPPQTVLLAVTATGADPTQAAAIANSAAIHLADAVEAIETPENGTSPVKVTQVLQASAPAAPVSPRIGVNLALGLLIGFGIGVGQAVLRERLDTSVRSRDALVCATDAPLLGSIGVDPSTSDAPLAVLDRSSPRGEAYRTLRTNLRYVDVDHQPRVIAVTSPRQGEGKTTVACNLAVSMAQAGAAVCLVEADLRRPAAAQLLGIDSAVGLTDALVGVVGLPEALIPWRRGMLHVLPAGAPAPNPSELLSSQQLRTLLSSLTDRFDVVVLDSAPLLPVADGAIVAAAADGALLVARHGATTADQAAQAAQALHRVDARLLGTVLNAAPVGSRSNPYGYGYGDYGSADGDVQLRDGHQGIARDHLGEMLH